MKMSYNLSLIVAHFTFLRVMIFVTFPLYNAMTHSNFDNEVIVIIYYIAQIIYFSSSLTCIFIFVASIFINCMYSNLNYSNILNRLKLFNLSLSAKKLSQLLHQHNAITLKFVSIQNFFRVLFLPLFILTPLLNVMMFVVIFTDGFGDNMIRYIFSCFSTIISIVWAMVFLQVWIVYVKVKFWAYKIIILSICIFLG